MHKAFRTGFECTHKLNPATAANMVKKRKLYHYKADKQKLQKHRVMLRCAKHLQQIKYLNVVAVFFLFRSHRKCSREIIVGDNVRLCVRKFYLTSYSLDLSRCLCARETMSVQGVSSL